MTTSAKVGPQPVGAKNAVTSCDLHVLVHETAEPVASEWLDRPRRRAGECGRQADGAGADRSRRVGADGEFEVAALLATLTGVSRWDRWRGRGPGWFVLHSVELG